MPKLKGADGLTNAIADALKTYSKEVTEELDTAKKEVAKETAKDLKSMGGFKDVTGVYRKSWRAKKVGNAWVVHNLNHQLTHLLEKGHVNRYGGRTKSYPHISIAEKDAIDKFMKRVEEAVKR